MSSGSIFWLIAITTLLVFDYPEFQEFLFNALQSANVDAKWVGTKVDFWERMHLKFLTRWIKHLSGSLSKSGPLDFGTKNNFSSFFVREKGSAHIYKKAIYYFPVSYFCFATSQNCILAELRLRTVIRKVKFSDFVKRATKFNFKMLWTAVWTRQSLVVSFRIIFSSLLKPFLFYALELNLVWNITEVFYKVTFCFLHPGWAQKLQFYVRLIDLFHLYILFTQYRSCDDTQEIWSFVLFIKKSACKHEYSLFNEQDKGSNLLSIITCNNMEQSVSGG